jgi:hypothetical protein
VESLSIQDWRNDSAVGTFMLRQVFGESEEDETLDKESVKES